MFKQMKFPLATATAVMLFAPPTWAGDNKPQTVASIDEPTPAQFAPPESPDRTASEPPLRRYFVHASYGFNVMTWTGTSGKIAASTVTPSDKVIQYQQVGIGYWVHPNIRLQLTGIFGETLSGLKPGQSSFTLGGVIPCVMYTNGGFFAGGGPLFAPRAFGADNFNFGIFSVAGYAVPLGAGLSLAGAVQAPVMFVQKDSVAVTPALILAERF
jgi:hypothetical protein